MFKVFDALNLNLWCIPDQFLLFWQRFFGLFACGLEFLQEMFASFNVVIRGVSVVRYKQSNYLCFHMHAVCMHQTVLIPKCFLQYCFVIYDMSGTNSRRHLILWKYNSSGCLTTLKNKCAMESLTYSK